MRLVAGEAGLPCCRESRQGTPDIEYVTFNSNLNVPSYGDERAFFDGKPSTRRSAGGFLDDIAAEPGDEFVMRMFIHNNANVAVDGKVPVAEGTTPRVLLPTGRERALCAWAYLSAANAQPPEVADSVLFFAESPFSLDYVEGSARILSNSRRGRLSDEVIRNGVSIGTEQNDGRVPGGFANDLIVTFKVGVI